MIPDDLNAALRTGMDLLVRAKTHGLDNVQPALEQHILDLLEVQARQAHDMSLPTNTLRTRA